MTTYISACVIAPMLSACWRLRMLAVSYAVLVGWSSVGPWMDALKLRPRTCVCVMAS